jgi:hypothetical protein
MRHGKTIPFPGLPFSGEAHHAWSLEEVIAVLG